MLSFSCLPYDPFFCHHPVVLHLDMFPITQPSAGGLPPTQQIPQNTDPTRYHCCLPRRELGGTWKEFPSLWGGVCASNKLCLIYNIACTDAAAFQKVPLQLHWRIEQFYPASSLSLYVSISLYWREMLERKKNPFLTFFFWVPYVLQNQIEHMLRRWQVGTKAGRIRLLIAAKNSYTSNHCKPALLTEWWKADNTLPSRVRLS